MIPKPFRILLAEDHLLVRAGFRAILANQPDLEIVAETGNGQEALLLAIRHQPDIAVLDITMPGLNGLEVAGRLRPHVPGLKIIFLSMHQNQDYILTALRAGALGYLVKDSKDDELERAIRTVLRGEYYLSAVISKQVVNQYLQSESNRSLRLDILTSRQREILQLLAEGSSAKEIAALLDISVKTVEAHRVQMMERLEIRDFAGLVRYAIRTGLVSQET